MKSPKSATDPDVDGNGGDGNGSVVLGLIGHPNCGQVFHGESSDGWEGGECEGHAGAYQDPADVAAERKHLPLW